MSALDFFLADQNGPFLAALTITLAIAAVEVVSLAFGLGLSDLVDSVLPDLDVDLDLDIDGPDIDGPDIDGPDVDGPDVGAAGSNVFVQAFGWLNVGRVPFLILLVAFAGSFAIGGFAIQLAARESLGLLPALMVAPVAFAFAVPTTRLTSRIVGRLVPREESYAVREAEFVGLMASITLGPVERDTPGKARIIDRHGNVHFVRVRAEAPDARFEVSNQVLLVRRDGTIFDVIAAPDSLA